MKIENKRLCIYPKDIQRITGKSYRQSIRMLLKIRKDLNKLQNELVSIEEFCHYTSLKYEQVERLIIGQFLRFTCSKNKLYLNKKQHFTSLIFSHINHTIFCLKHLNSLHLCWNKLQDFLQICSRSKSETLVFLLIIST